MLALYTATALLSALLLFMVEPMFAKMVLPMLGGSPAVWNTAVVFYQTSLVIGYVYAHGITAWLGVRRQAALHLLVLLLPLAVLPVAIPAGWNPPTTADPILWMLLLMVVTVSLPFTVLSASSPLLQKWFASTGHPSSGEPYFLYAASNVGSLLGLLGYPLLVENYLGLRLQSLLWAGGYGLFAVLMIACALALWPLGRILRQQAVAAAVSQAPQAPVAVELTFVRRARWVVLAFIPSSLMLSVTASLSTEIAPFPLLWAIPLSIYLITFILVFSPRNPFTRTAMIRAMPILILPIIMTLTAKVSLLAPVLVPVHLFALFVICMVCHRALADDRPSTEHLTDFYLWLSVGGALGGVFTSLMAPVLFSSVLEYPLVLILACLMLPAPPVPAKRQARWLDVGLPIALAMVMAGLAVALRRARVDSPRVLILSMALPGMLCFSFSRRPLRFGLGVAAMLAVGTLLGLGAQGPALHQERSFFGTKTVLTVAGSAHSFHVLYHGVTVHGIQNLDPSHRCEALSYYASTGPIGEAFAAFEGTGKLRRIAVVGLGAGSLASYSSPDQEWTFYEIDPAVERIARNPSYFTFLTDCAPNATVVLGDARLSLARAPSSAFDFIILDAYSGDSIPLHLVSREAVRLYLQKLAPGGLLAFHISNQYFDLAPMLATLARDAQLVYLLRKDLRISLEESAAGKTASSWVVMAREIQDMGSLAQDQRWVTVPAQAGKPWTDDFSSVLWALRW